MVISSFVFGQSFARIVNKGAKGGWIALAILSASGWLISLAMILTALGVK